MPDGNNREGGAMALITRGKSLCPLCQRVLEAGDDIFGTWGVWLPRTDPLWQFCDAAMHWPCYAQWEHQSGFARSYFEAWVGSCESNPHWKPAYRDDLLLVTVNPAPPVEAAWVHLAATGTRHNPKLSAWADWLHEGAGIVHPLEAAALEAARRILRNQVPTADALIARLA
jgi:hypothetical protein